MLVANAAYGFGQAENPDYTITSPMDLVTLFVPEDYSKTRKKCKKGSAAERELQGTDLKAYRGTTKICDAVIHALRC